MKGRKPKAPGLRQRRNKNKSAAVLQTEAELSNVKVPPLPKRAPGTGEWLPASVDFWNDAWRSPMAQKWLRGDRFRILILLDHVERYWRGQVDLARTIQLEADSHGLSSFARHRLGWEVRDRPVEEEPIAAGDGDVARPAVKVRKRTKPKGDSRNVLRGDFS